MAEQTEVTEELASLRSYFNGEVIVPGDPGYDQNREHFNKLYDMRPAMITRPTGTMDVVRAIDYARAAGLEIAVSSGGKHGGGFSRTDGGLVIDLSLMRGVRVDPRERTVWAQAGANGGDLQAEALVHGLAGVIGWMRGTGIGGVNLNGGFGMLSSKLGWGADTILELELVTPEGEVLRVAPDENPDLFWALRGAGSNFGVVTWIKQRLCPVPEQVLAGMLIYDEQQAPKVLRILRDFVMEAPDDLTLWASYTVVPEDPAYPKEMHGRPAFVVTLVHIGNPEQAADDVRPLREVIAPAIDGLAPQGLFDFMCSMDEYIVANRQWYDSVELARLDDSVIELFDEYAHSLAEGGLIGEIILVPHGRGRHPDVPNALPIGGPGSWSVVTGLYWDNKVDDDRNEGWSRSVISALRDGDFTLPAVYGNMANPRDIERDRRSYGEQDWRRLTELKAKYDPENRFHLNHNIPPA